MNTTVLLNLTHLPLTETCLILEAQLLYNQIYVTDTLTHLRLYVAL